MVQISMSPVSPVFQFNSNVFILSQIIDHTRQSFHTEATVSIGLKNVLKVGTSILKY